MGFNTEGAKRWFFSSSFFYCSIDYVTFPLLGYVCVCPCGKELKLICCMFLNVNLANVPTILFVNLPSVDS